MPPKKPKQHLALASSDDSQESLIGDKSKDLRLVRGQPDKTPAERREAYKDLLAGVEAEIHIHGIWRKYQNDIDTTIEENRQVRRETKQYVVDNKELLDRGRYDNVQPTDDGIIEALKSAQVTSLTAKLQKVRRERKEAEGSAEALSRELVLKSANFEEEVTRHTKTQQNYDDLLASVQQSTVFAGENMEMMQSEQKSGLDSIKDDITSAHEATVKHLRSVQQSLANAEQNTVTAVAEAVGDAVRRIGRENVPKNVVDEFDRVRQELNSRALKAEAGATTADSEVKDLTAKLAAAIAHQSDAENGRDEAKKQADDLTAQLEAVREASKTEYNGLVEKYEAAAKQNQAEVVELSAKMTEYEKEKAQAIQDALSADNTVLQAQATSLQDANTALQADISAQTVAHTELQTNARLAQELAGARETARLLQARIDRDERSGDRIIADLEVTVEKAKTSIARGQTDKQLLTTQVGDRDRHLRDLREQLHKRQVELDKAITPSQLDLAKSKAYTQALNRFMASTSSDSDRRFELFQRQSEIIVLNERINEKATELLMTKAALSAAKTAHIDGVQQVRQQWINNNEVLVGASRRLQEVLREQVITADKKRDEAVSANMETSDRCDRRERELSEQIDDLNTRISTLREQQTTSATTIQQLKHDKEILNTDKQRLASDNTAAKAAAQDTETDLRRQLQEQKNAVAQEQETNARLLQGMVREGNVEYEWMDKFLEEHRVDIEKKDKMVTDAEHKAGAAGQEAATLKQENTKLETKNTELGEHIKRIKNELETSVANRSSAQDQQAMLESTSRRSVKLLEDEQARLKNKLADVKALCSLREDAIRAREAEIDDLTAGGEELLGELADAKDCIEELRVGVDGQILATEAYYDEHREEKANLQADVAHYKAQATRNDKSTQLLRSDLADLRKTVTGEQDLRSELREVMRTRREAEMDRDNSVDEVSRLQARLTLVETSEETALAEASKLRNELREVKYTIRDNTGRKTELMEQYDRKVLLLQSRDNEILEYKHRQYKLAKRATVAEDAWRKNKLAAKALYERWMAQRAYSRDLATGVAHALGDGVELPEPAEIPKDYEEFASGYRVDEWGFT
ncbi:hypothetical protein B0A48_04695 [Cryoendolithus antarcticus]|uniref:Uncharacterized protein n=1 Tax=Cryoendolithus antarcticus TaxID=1507870 RepID=A0A1V8TD23_9PEZI|nr:hypothetical protein B0A48_04695 [Cryoendolithus antarcticus]